MASIAFNILFPSRYSIDLSKLRQQLDAAHLAWAMEQKARQAEFKIENIRFTHDAGWNKRLFSLQAVADGEIWFWKVTHIIVTFSGLSI
jgi:hypothetical protein